MKRLNNIYQEICGLQNLERADIIARRGKLRQKGVILHNADRHFNIAALHISLLENTYRTSAYTTFKVFEPKERTIFRLPYYPDRILHHAIMNILEPVFLAHFTADTFCCIKGKGIHAAARAVRNALNSEANTTYCLKLDVKKFYPSVDHNILKSLLERKFKDVQLLELLFEIIDSTEGLPIGNYLSQYLANFYLTPLDRFIKETLRVRYYFRYADDIVILGDDKPTLHNLLAAIREFLSTELKLTIKANYQVFPVAARSIDFVGYRFYHTHTLLRKSIKKRFAKAAAKGRNPLSLASYYGWAKHCNSKRLLSKLETLAQRNKFLTNNHNKKSTK